VSKRRGAPQQGDHAASIEHNGRTYHGTYKVGSDGVVQVWTTTRDGVMVGPMPMVLRGMPAEAAAKNVLREYADAHP
jgi:hypothetical protein